MDVFSVRPLRACAAAGAVLTALLTAAAPAFAAEPDGAAVVSRYGEMLATSNDRLSLSERRELAERVLLLSSYYRLDPRLLIALVSVESAWRTRAMSPVGARGLGQLMPGTAAALNVDAFETYENLDGTARYLRRLLMRFPQYQQRVRYRYALAAYNAGPGAVDRYHGIPPYAETQSYVTHVMSLWDRFTHAAVIPSRAAFALAQRAVPAVTAVPVDHHYAQHAQRAQATIAYSASMRRSAHTPLLARGRPFVPTRIEPPPLQIAVADEYLPRRGLFAFLHRRRRAPGADPHATPAPGEDAIAEQSAFLRPRAALRHL